MVMLSAVSDYILGAHQFGSKNMRTGFIPFESPEGYRLTDREKKILSDLYVAPTDVNADYSVSNEKNRIAAMADRAKAMIVGLFEAVANFAKNPNERSNLTNALILGLSSGIDRGRELLRFNFKTNLPIYNQPSQPQSS